MSKRITLLGSIGGETLYTEADVKHLLDKERTHLSHGHTFTGRPHTEIYLSEETVLKIHGELRLDARSAHRWAVQALEKEQLYQVHHPHKTWFVVEIADEPSLIGNLCPRLSPLHETFNSALMPLPERLAYFEQLFKLYFELAHRTNNRLDEGLSNFGSTADGVLYYLDDDIYSWDRFMSCAHILGVYFRSLRWITTTVAAQLGTIVRTAILNSYADKQYLFVLAEQLQEVFIPNPQQRAALEVFIDTLRGPVVQPKTQQFKQERYIALLADIHANLPALQAVLAFLRTENISQGIVLGDVVGYGPHPNECIAVLQASDFTILKGNHDHALATHNYQKGFSQPAAWVLEWSVNRVSDSEKTWLADLPPVVHYPDWMAVHGAPMDATFFNAYVYEMTYHDNLDTLQRKQVPLCFHGHTHIPGVYARRNSIMDNFYSDSVIDLTQFTHALICPGSIGQPRNGIAGAQFAIYDQQVQKVYYHNVSYDLTEMLDFMTKEQFPPILMQLLQGNA